MTYEELLNRSDELMNKQLKTVLGEDDAEPLSAAECIEYTGSCEALRRHRIDNYHYLLETLQDICGQLEDSNPLPDSLAVKLVDEIVETLGNTEEVDLR